MMSPRLCAMLMICGLATVASSVMAQTPSAHIRLWMVDPHGSDDLRVCFRPDVHHSTICELGSGTPGYRFDNYIEVPAGRGMLEAYVTGEKNKQPRVSLATNFEPGTFLTVLLRDGNPASSGIKLDVIEENDSASGATSQITVRNFIDDLKGMQVVIGEGLNAQFVPGSGFLVMRGIKPAVYQIHTSGITPDGRHFEWTNEADLKNNRSQTLVVYPDPYGRIRPRLIADGCNTTKAIQQDEGQQ